MGKVCRLDGIGIDGLRTADDARKYIRGCGTSARSAGTSSIKLHQFLRAHEGGAAGFARADMQTSAADHENDRAARRRGRTISVQHIDSFCHFFPQGIFAKLSETTGGTRDIGKRIQGVRTIYDLAARFRTMDGFENYSQVLSLGLPAIDAMVGPDKSPEFARVANDGLAELVAKYPDRFCGYVGGLPMNAPDEAAKEAERILVHGNANGLQLHTNVDGLCLDEPRFFPIFEIAAKAGKPILLHPARTANFPDFAAEKRSRYEIWTIFGWPYETSATMARLIFSGVMTRLPTLKVLAHHLGAMIPFFDLRMETGWATLGSRTSDEDYSGVLKSLGKPLLDCFKDFTATPRYAAAAPDLPAAWSSTVAIMCCLRPTRHSDPRAGAPISVTASRRSTRSTSPKPTRRRSATATRSRCLGCIDATAR